MDAGPPEPVELLRYRPLVRRLAREVAGREQEAQEIEQRVWLRVLQHPPRHAGGLASWLRLVVRSVATNLRERDLHRQVRERDYGSADRRHEAGVDDGERERMLCALERLDPAKAQALRLRFLEGRSAAEIARELGLPLETVRTRLERGLAEVRARLAPET